MIEFLKASLGVVIRRYPARSFVNAASLSHVVSVYVFALIVSALEMLIDPNFQNSPLIEIGYLIGGNVLGLVAIVVVTRWLINRYAQEKFSFQQVFTLEVLLISGSTIVFGIVSSLLYLLGDMGYMAGSVFSLIFGLYMLLTFQAAISHIASITKSQAALVILAPVFLFILVWFALIAAAGFAAANP